MDGRAKDREPILPTQQGLTGPFGVRHHADHVAPRVGDSGDVAQGAVGIRGGRHSTVGGAVAEDDPPGSLEGLKGLPVGAKVALALGYRDSEHLPGTGVQGKLAVALLNPVWEPLTSTLAG